MLSPIIIFAFNRPTSLSNLIESLKQNEGYNQHDIYVYVDGPRNENDVIKVNQVVAEARKLTNNVIVSEVNKGLGPSIISGVSDIINKYGKAIILEDDLILMPGFLKYMDSALTIYESDNRIISVCGYGPKIKRPKNYLGDVYLCNRSASWGWATWKDRWNTVDWNVSDWEELRKSKSMQHSFNRGGSDMYDMLKGYMEGKNRSWAIRFCYSQFKQGRYSLHPFQSLIANEGYGADATNCRQKYSRFTVELNQDLQALSLPKDLVPNKSVISQAAHYHSLPKRLYSKIRGILNI